MQVSSIAVAGLLAINHLIAFLSSSMMIYSRGAAM